MDPQHETLDSNNVKPCEIDPPAPPSPAVAVAAPPPLTVHAFPSGGYVWDAAGAERIRLEHGIVGAMAGSLPCFALQNKVKGLPLLLSLEELAAAAAMGVARVQASANHAPRAETLTARSAEGAQTAHRSLMQKRVSPRADDQNAGGVRDLLSRLKGSGVREHPCLLDSSCSHQPPCSLPRVLAAAQKKLGSEKFRLPVSEEDVQAAAEWAGGEECGLGQQGGGNFTEGGRRERSAAEATVECGEGAGVTVGAGDSSCNAGGEERAVGVREKEGDTGDTEGGARGGEDDAGGESKNRRDPHSPSPSSSPSPSIPLPPPHSHTPLLSTLTSLLHSSSPTTRLLCLVYSDLLSRACRLTCGLRFGAHWLVYPGGSDPSEMHAAYMVRVQRQQEGISAQQLLASARVAMASRKRLVLATAHEGLLQREGFWEWFLERFGAVQVGRRDGEEGARLVRGMLGTGSGEGEEEEVAALGEGAEGCMHHGWREQQHQQQQQQHQQQQQQHQQQQECVGGKQRESAAGCVEYTTVVTDLDFLPLELRTQNPLKARRLQEEQQQGVVVPRGRRKTGLV